MKANPTKGLIVFALLSVLFFIVIVVMNNLTIKQQGNREEENENRKKKYWETGADRQLGMFFQTRAYPDPYFINEKFAAAWQHAKAMRPPTDHARVPGQRTNLGGWASLNGPYVGRVISIAIHPTTTSTVFIGTASGGIWKTTNSGTNWSFVPTNEAVLGVPTIVYHPTSPNIMLAGTGEVYRVDTSNIGYNIWKARGTYGVGIIRSTDGGVTWTQVMNKTYPELFGIQMIKFDPTNPNIVYAATTHGLFKSTDAGATWAGTPILNKIYVSDVVINSADNQQMLAAVGNLVNTDKGIYRTTDGGANWSKIASALPTTFSGYTRFAYLSGSTVYASIGRDDANENELYRSTNFGTTWTALATSHHCQYQFWFANAVAIIPSRPDSIYMGGVNFYRYRVSTATRSSIGGSMHADHHDIKFDPSNNNIAYVANDGGMYRTANALATTPTFTEINTGLNISQFYASFGVSKTTANRYVGGLQDNGVWSYNGAWTKEFGGDGGPSVVDPTNDAIVYASNDARSVSKSTTGVTGTYGNVLSSWAFIGDDRTAFMAPVAISKTTPTTLYVASDNLHKTTNSGTAWTNNSGTLSANTAYMDAQFKTGIAIAVSDLTANNLFISISNLSQRVDNALNVVGQPNFMRSLNGGTLIQSIKNSLPDRFVLDIAISPTNDDSVFVTLGGFGSPNIYVTGNAKAILPSAVTWTGVGGGILPNVPYNAICFDPINRNVIYAGCDLGVYVSPDRGLTWYDFNTGMADTDPVMVYDLQTTFDNKIIAATHGRGVFRSDPFDPNTLPVTMKEFSGYHDRGNNRIKWVVEQESNIKQYELERSVNAGPYTKVATVTARNIQTAHAYGYTDPVGSNTTANYYYRLKTLEMDGTFKYSSVLLIQVKNNDVFNVLNNPVTDKINIKLQMAAPQQVQISLFDMNGRMVKRSNINAQAGSLTYVVTGIEKLPKGMYVVEAIVNRERFTEKIVKN